LINNYSNYQIRKKKTATPNYPIANQHGKTILNPSWQ
jgi:hypothetical protein